MNWVRAEGIRSKVCESLASKFLVLQPSSGLQSSFARCCLLNLHTIRWCQLVLWMFSRWSLIMQQCNSAPNCFALQQSTCMSFRRESVAYQKLLMGHVRLLAGIMNKACPPNPQTSCLGSDGAIPALHAEPRTRPDHRPPMIHLPCKSPAANSSTIDCQ